MGNCMSRRKLKGKGRGISTENICCETSKIIPRLSNLLSILNYKCHYFSNAVVKVLNHCLAVSAGSCRIISQYKSTD